MLRILPILIRRARRLLFWLWRHEGTPSERARGLAVGVFSGCFPLFGFQIILGLFLARLLKANHLLAVGGTWISNPVTYLPLYWFNYHVGSFFLGYGPGSNDLEQISLSNGLTQGLIFSGRILLGSAITGLTLAFFIGSVAYYWLKKHSK